MNNLEKLEKLVLKAKVRAKSGELKRELNDASEGLRQAKSHYDDCRANIRETRQTLQEVEAAQARLKVVNHELAQFRVVLYHQDMRAHAHYFGCLDHAASRQSLFATLWVLV